MCGSGTANENAAVGMWARVSRRGVARRSHLRPRSWAGQGQRWSGYGHWEPGWGVGVKKVDGRERFTGGSNRDSARLFFRRVAATGGGVVAKGGRVLRWLDLVCVCVCVVRGGSGRGSRGSDRRAECKSEEMKERGEGRFAYTRASATWHILSHRCVERQRRQPASVKLGHQQWKQKVALVLRQPWRASHRTAPVTCVRRSARRAAARQERAATSGG